MLSTDNVKIVRPDHARTGRLGGLGVRFMVSGDESGGRFSLVEHPLAPRALAAPMHRHTREDEYSFIVTGRVGADLGGRVVFGQPGDLIFKPRAQWHTFWNAGDTEASLLEIISPAGFERYFEELIDLFTDGTPKPELIGAVAARDGLEVDPGSIRGLTAAHGVVFE